MRIVFFIYDFVPAKFPLQPWLTILKVAEYLRDQGHEIHVVTDTDDVEEVPGFSFHCVSSLRGNNSTQVRAVMRRINPDRCIALVTPLNLVTSGWYASLREVGSYAFASYPFYGFTEIARAFGGVEFKNVKGYASHRFAPRFLWARALAKNFRGVICQSQSSARHLERLTRGRLNVHAIVPGIDRKLWSLSDAPATRGNSGFLYVGTASRIRGFHVVLDALEKLSDPGVRLTVLARGADEQGLDEIQTQVDRRGLGNCVTVRGGWLDQAQLVREIQAAKAVLLPFILVPSELPVSVMESIACGTPVITTRIDGLPSTVGDGGLLVEQGDAGGLAAAIALLNNNDSELKVRRLACVRQAAQMQSWDQMSRSWEEVLIGNG